MNPDYILDPDNLDYDYEMDNGVIKLYDAINMIIRII